MKQKSQLNIMYCYDDMYDYLVDGVKPEDYPYMMIVALHDHRSQDYVQNPHKLRRQEEGFYLSNEMLSPTEFSLFNIISDGKKDIVPLKDVKPKLFKHLDKSFKRADEVSDNFKIDFGCVVSREEEYFSIREHVDDSRFTKEKNMYSTRAYGVELDNDHNIRCIGSNAFTLSDDYTANDNVIIFDPRQHYEYMFDKRFNARVSRDIETECLKLSKLYASIQFKNLNAATFDINQGFFAHVFLFKTRTKMESYGHFFQKKYDRDCHFGMHSSVDDPVNKRVKKLSSLSKDLDIRTGPVSNKNKPYEIIFDWDYVEMEDMYDDILKEISEGTFYMDKKIGKNTRNLEKSPIYIDEEKFINKMKLKTKWKKCINSIVVNDQET